MPTKDTADAGRVAIEPIASFVSKLSIQGSTLIELSGYMTALWHMRTLNDHRMPCRIADVRAAIKKASDAVDAYEAALSSSCAEVGK